MTDKYTLLLALCLALGSASAQYADPVGPTPTVNNDFVVDSIPLDVSAAGLLVRHNLVEGAFVRSETQGTIYSDADTVCTGFFVEIGDYVTLGFPCLPSPQEFEYRHTTWDQNHNKFEVYRCIGKPSYKFYRLVLE